MNHPDMPHEPSSQSLFESDDYMTVQATQRSAIPAALDLFTQIRQRTLTQLDTQDDHDVVFDDE